MAHSITSMALFCDFENVALGVRDAKYAAFDIRKVLERLLLKGNIVVKKAYCDWERYKEFKKAMHEARPILLEPVMKIEVRVPEEYVGAVMGDLNSRRAKVQGMEPLARGVLIRALCPHAEAMTYDADLRSLTQGVGYFTMEPSHYDPVPPHIAQKIIEKRRAEGKVKGVEEEK